MRCHDGRRERAMIEAKGMTKLVHRNPQQIYTCKQITQPTYQLTVTTRSNSQSIAGK